MPMPVNFVMVDLLSKCNINCTDFIDEYEESREDATWIISSTFIIFTMQSGLCVFIF